MKKNYLLILIGFYIIQGLFFSQQAFAAKKTIEKRVPFSGTLRLYLTDLKRFLNTSPDIIAVQKIEQDVIEIATNNVGKGILVVWTEQGRFMVTIDVYRPKPPISRSSILNDFMKSKKNYFIFEANVYTDYFQSDEDDVGDSRKTNLITGDYTLSGPTLFGETGAYASIIHDLEKDDRETNRWLLFLRDGHVADIRNFEMDAGQFEQNGSENLLPSLLLEGVRIGNFRDIKKGGFVPEEAEVFYGKVKARSLYEGYFFLREVEEADKRKVSGFRAAYKRVHKLPWFEGPVEAKNEFLFRHTTDLKDEGTRNDFLYSHSSRIGKNNFSFNVLDLDLLSSLDFSLYGEKDRLDYGIDFTAIPNLEGDYQQIGRRWLGLTGIYQLDLGAHKASMDEVEGYVKGKQDYLQEEDDYSSVGYDYGIKARGKIYDAKYRLEWKIKDYSDLINATKEQERKVSLQKYWEFWRKVNTYLTVTERDTVSDIASGVDFTIRTFNWGVGFRIIENLNAYYSQSVSDTLDGDDENTRESDSLSLGLSYSRRLLSNLSLLSTLSTTRSKIESFPSNNIQKRDSLGLDLGLNYFFTRIPGSAFARADVRKIDEVITERPDKDYYEYRLKTGFKFRFATFPGLMPKAHIEGYLFKDKNGNGRFDEGDEPMSGKRVQLEKGLRETETDDNGYYRFENFRGLKVNVAVRMEDIPKGYVVTTLSNYSHKIKNKETYRCDFGIAISNQVWGYVYGDLNENGKYDEDDKPFSNIIVRLDDTMTAVTDMRGFFSFVSLAKGKYGLSLDYSNLPFNYYSIDKMKRSLEVEEGKITKVDFSFGAERRINGRVFYDKDGDGFFTRDVDEPMTGVLIKGAGRESQTNKKGRYVLKRLPSGNITVTLDETTLPSDMFSGVSKITINLMLPPEALKDIDFPVEKR